MVSLVGLWKASTLCDKTQGETGFYIPWLAILTDADQFQKNDVCTVLGPMGRHIPR